MGFCLRQRNLALIWRLGDLGVLNFRLYFVYFPMLNNEASYHTSAAYSLHCCRYTDSRLSCTTLGAAEIYL